MTKETLNLAKKQRSINAVIIGKNLKEIRKKHRYSQKEIGKIIGVSFQQVQKYENGSNRLPIEKLYHLKNLYRVSYGRFFEGVEEDKNNYSNQNAATINEISTRVLNLKDQNLKKKICKIVLTLLD